MSIMMAIMMYLVDAYELYAASALAANTIIRSIAGATLPLCGLKYVLTGACPHRRAFQMLTNHTGCTTSLAWAGATVCWASLP